MTLTNCYTDLDTLKGEVGITTTTTQYDLKLETAISSASRLIDGFCGRFFYQDTSVATRTYYATDYDCVWTDDISTTTGLIVKTDDGDDGTFATTLTLTTNFILLPTNAAVQYPVQPYTAIRLVDSGITAFPMSNSGRPGVQVTAKFGWPAVPDDVAKACLIQAVQNYKASDAPFGALNFDAGVVRIQSNMHPQAAGLLERWVKPRVA